MELMVSDVSISVMVVHPVPWTSCVALSEGLMLQILMDLWSRAWLSVILILPTQMCVKWRVQNLRQMWVLQCLLFAKLFPIIYADVIHMGPNNICFKQTIREAEKIYLGPHGAPPQARQQESNASSHRQRFKHKLREADGRFPGTGRKNKVETLQQLVGSKVSSRGMLKTSPRDMAGSTLQWVSVWEVSLEEFCKLKIYRDHPLHGLEDIGCCLYWLLSSLQTLGICC